MQINESDFQNANKLFKSIKSLSVFTKEELDALCGYIPMTKNLFDSCYEKFMYMNMYDDIYDLIKYFSK